MTGRKKSAKFVPEEFWNINALLHGSNPPDFEARLYKIDGKKAKIGDGRTPAEIVAALKSLPFVVARVEKKEVKKILPAALYHQQAPAGGIPMAPFFSKENHERGPETLRGDRAGKRGPVGLITYMRTDSVRIAAEALKEARDYIQDHYDPAYLPPKPRVFKTPDRRRTPTRRSGRHPWTISHRTSNPS